MTEQVFDGKCVFCAIVQGSIPADVVFQDDEVIAFRDIHPQAPVHIVVTPKTHAFTNVVELAAEPSLLAHMALVAGRIADGECGGEFRLVFNTGESAGQTVFHVHEHILGGDLSESRLA